jgi:hypothetical protein
MPWSRAEGRGEQEEKSVGNRTAASGRWPPGLEELLRRSQEKLRTGAPMRDTAAGGDPSMHVSVPRSRARRGGGSANIVDDVGEHLGIGPVG